MKRNGRNSQGGYTLMELMVAMSLASLVAGIAGAAFVRFGAVTFRQENGRHGRHLAQVSILALHKTMLSAAGIRRVGPKQVIMIDEAGQEMELSGEGDSVLFRGKSLLFVSGLDVSVWRNSSPLEKEEDRLFGWPGDNGQGDLNQLDLDGSGALEGAEIMNIGLLGLHFNLAANSGKDGQTVWIRPRNSANMEGLEDEGRMVGKFPGTERL